MLWLEIFLLVVSCNGCIDSYTGIAGNSSNIINKPIRNLKRR